MKDDRVKKTAFVVCAASCALPGVGNAVALVLGVLFSLLIGNPWRHRSSLWSKTILQISVVGLGFGLGVSDVLRAGKESLLYTVAGITFTLLVSLLMSRLFKIQKNTAALISFGTAICGGSAIAAMAPVIRAKDDETGIALATVFTLNSVALLLFPLVGRGLHLSQEVFGTWAGLAIHDTSSVVGAAASFGARALATATTVKLARAVWITPLAIGVSWLKGSHQRAAVPLFIIGFIAAATLRTLVPQLNDVWNGLHTAARQSLAVTLFLIGSGLSRDVLRNVGMGPLLHGITLWLLVSSLTLFALVFVGLA